jgi:serine/threonine protein kinase
VGTRIYAAPEVGDGNQQYDFAADIWSAGGVLVYLLFKQHPFSTHSNAGRLLTTAELNERKRQLLINWPVGACLQLT